MGKQDIRAIAFDFGNTLIPWDETQYWGVTRPIIERIREIAPGHDFDSAYGLYSVVRVEECARSLPFVRENDVRSMYSKTIEGLRGRPATEGEIESILRVHTDAFANVCHAPEGLHELLGSLSSEYRLAVLSNYSVGEAIRGALRKCGLDGHFEFVMVSADLGIIKPGRRIFESLLSELELPPEQVLFVGDDFIADVIGAWAAGMPCVHITNSVAEKGMTAIHNIFRQYFEQALQLPELAGWESAKPVAVMDSVFGLQSWLKEQGT